jgi:carbonic anhydrase
VIERLFSQNAEWATAKTRQDPQFFSRLATLQAPKYMWIGCSDSRVSADVITGLQPGEIFVHRNVANLAHPADLNYLSVLQFAVDVLKVEHIIVCGHYGCGGVRAAMERDQHGLIDNWLQPIRDIAMRNRPELDAIADENEKLMRLCELNVQAQVRRVSEATPVQDAWHRGQQLSVHGWVYGLADGLLRSLNVTRSGLEP